MSGADWLIVAIIAAAVGGIAWLAWLSRPRGRHERQEPIPVHLPAMEAPPPPLDASGWLRGLNEVFGSMTTTNLARDPDDPYDPEEDALWSWREQTLADLAPDALDGDPYGTEAVEAWIRDGMRVNWVSEDPGPGGGFPPLSPPPGPDPAPVSWSADEHDGEGEGRAFHGLNHADAHFNAELSAELRAMDDDMEEFLSALRRECAQARLDLAEALA